MLLRDKGFLRRFFSLYWAIVLQNVVVLSVNLVDNIMLGAYSENALSGAAAVNQLQFFLQMVVNGFGGGLVVLLSQYWAQARPGPIRRLVTFALWGVSTALQTVILGHMEASTAGAIAANSMATTLFSILKTASVGAASVAAILIGGAVGSGDLGRVKRDTKTMQVMFLLIGLITSAALYFLRGPILSLYSMRPQTKEMASQFLLVLCVTGVGTAYQMPVITGIIRGGGDARFGMINDLVTIWGLVVPLSLLAAFRFQWPPVAVMACLNADQILKCAAGAVKVNRYRWVKQLTRAEA